MKNILFIFLAILFLGCQTKGSFDTSLLNPEVIDHNIPNTVEPYAAPEVVKNLAPIRAQFDNLAITEESEKINPRMTSFAKQMAKTIYEPVKDKVFLMAGWQLTSTLIVVGKGRVKDAIKNGNGSAKGDLNNLDVFASFFDFSKSDINLSSR